MCSKSKTGDCPNINFSPTRVFTNFGATKKWVKQNIQLLLVILFCLVIKKTQLFLMFAFKLKLLEQTVEMMYFS